MHCQKWVVTALLLAPGVMAFAQSPEMQMQQSQERVVFFSGKVVIEGGSAPPDPVLIQRVCSGRIHDEPWTDAKGEFSFKVDASGSANVTSDAAQPPGQAADLNKAIGNSTQYSMPLSTALRDCELQGVLAGFRSERVNLALKGTMENARLGAIVLHPLSRASSLTVSATTLAAPAKAKKEYEKGMTAMAQQKWDAGARAFTKAVSTYPQFAVAWYELGLARQKSNDLTGAVDAWKTAVRSDPKYINPYERLTLAADQSGDWV